MKVELESERKVLKAVRDIKGDLFIDIGALWGEYAINLADNFKEVWAFEPAGDSRGILEENIKKYKKENIKVYPYALSNKRGEAQLWRHKDKIKGMTGIRKHYPYKDNEIVTLGKLLGKVETRTLDELVNGRKVDLIKIDVEGSELEVLQGGNETLKNTKWIVIEIHSYKKRNINFFMSFFRERKFEIKEVGERRFLGWKRK